MAGNWIPTDSTKAKAGELHLARLDRSTYDEDQTWEGDLGDINFRSDGTVTLEYHPTEDDNSQLVIVHGSYEHQGDTFRIEWQRNNRTPVLKMTLIEKGPSQLDDSTGMYGRRLEGGGVRFVQYNAG